MLQYIDVVQNLNILKHTLKNQSNFEIAVLPTWPILLSFLLMNVQGVPVENYQG